MDQLHQPEHSALQTGGVGTGEDVTGEDRALEGEAELRGLDEIQMKRGSRS